MSREIKLSILVPTTHKRWDNFNLKIQEQLFGQYERLTPEQQKEVEILIFVDTKSMMLGQKRNVMVNTAQGEYVVHVDSDDRIAPNYITKLLKAIDNHGTDVITFYAEVTIDGGKPKICDYSIRHKKDYNTPQRYNRLPNHICCIRKSVSKKSSFPNIIYGEDKLFAELLLPYIKTEHQIKEVLYYYDYNKDTSETQEFQESTLTYEHSDDAICDIVILSKAETPQLKRMTQNTIDTAIKGANGISVNVFVIEQVAEVSYDNAKTIFHTAPFNYNQFMNIGAREGKSENIIFCNNDLIFYDSYLHHLLASKAQLASPRCPVDGRQKNLKPNEVGTTNGRHFSGWCFMIKRSLWEKIGGLDEDFVFWYSDDATIQQCLQVGVKPMIVTNAICRHLGSTTFKRLDQPKQEEYTWEYTAKFNKKYNQNKFIDNPNYQDYLRRHEQK